MGPSYDITLSTEENALLNSEIALGFSQHPVTKLAEVFTNNSLNRKITENQFNTIVTELHLNTTEVDTVGSPMFNFYKSFKSKGNYDLTKMLVVMAMLGDGATQDRVGVIFDVLPGLLDGMATPESLDWLLDLIFLVAAKSLPRLAEADQSVRGVSLTGEQVAAYQARLEANLVLAKPAAIERILKNRARVSRQDLTRALDGEARIGNILRPVDARAFLLRAEFSPK